MEEEVRRTGMSRLGKSEDRLENFTTGILRFRSNPLQSKRLGVSQLPQQPSLGGLAHRKQLKAERAAVDSPPPQDITFYRAPLTSTSATSRHLCLSSAIQSIRSSLLRLESIDPPIAGFLSRDFDYSIISG